MEKIKTVHTQIKIREFVINFEYETWKGHHRKTDKRIVKHINAEEAKKAFNEAAEHFRTMFNVRILSIDEIAGENQVIDL